MRTFACFTSEAGSSVPALFFIIAEDEGRARVLIRREFLGNHRAVSVDVYEGDRLLWTEQI